ncbi:MULTISPECIES: CE1759 family FMN reductase [unclassified Pseudoclavibacter]|uniref:CE1759 family FMN reductase n=1 Tax=unclassified Pseudoclavibacter TaxID=2615177 RepID=UPI0017882441|nr:MULTISPECIES: CE1759 family FMN reductase [unclassified Pseudoclavibacter]
MPNSPHTVIVSGTLSTPSKTTALGEAIGASLVEHHGGDVQTIEVAALTGEIGRSLITGHTTEVLQDAVRRIEHADLLVAVSPVFKGSYSGLFKHLFDLVDPYALTAKPVILGATGGSQRHSLTVDYELRPLFTYFNANVSPIGVYATGDDFVDYQAVSTQLLQRIDRAASTLAVGASAADGGLNRVPEAAAVALG